MHLIGYTGKTVSIPLLRLIRRGRPVDIQVHKMLLIAILT